MSTKKQYDDLYGGVGRNVNFRPQRVLAREVADIEGLTLTVDGHRVVAHDLAMNGISFHAPAGAPVELGESVAVHIGLDGQPMYDGRGRVARLEELSRGLRVGVQLLTGFLDLPAIQRANEERTLRRHIGWGANSIRELVPAEFRELTEEAAFFLAHHRRLLDNAEARYREEGSSARELIDRLARDAADMMREPWNALRVRGAEIATRYMADPARRQAMKTYTESLVMTQLLDAPVLQRAYTKPLGYAGDFQVMNLILRNGFEGRSVFSRVFNKFGCEEELAAGVRTRKDLLKALHLTEMQRQRAAQPNLGAFHVTSLGCGPAREVSELLDEQQTLPLPTTWTLIDQEERALSLAHNEVYRALARTETPGSVRCLFMSFQQLIADPGGTLDEGGQNLVYASGLFDYLNKARAQALTRALYEHTAPGGTVAIANAISPCKSLWCGEFILDWPLILRTERQMREIAEVAPDAESVEVVAEPAGAYWFLLIRKPL